jgi:hypothetical protein
MGGNGCCACLLALINQPAAMCKSRRGRLAELAGFALAAVQHYIAIGFEPNPSAVACLV